MGASKRFVLSALAILIGLTPTLAPAQITSDARRNLETPFIWSQSEAEQVCPRAAAAANSQWTGQWRIAVPGRTSYCEVIDVRPPPVSRRPSAPEAKTQSIEAGPIWNQRDAEVKCRAVAEQARGDWTGQWRTVTPGRMSVCEIAFEGARSAPWPRYVEAGPIWNQADAQVKCPVVAAAVRGSWSGDWITTIEGEMSVCAITDMPAPAPRPVNAGPIWNQADANLKCPVAAIAVQGRWTGAWRTTRQGEASVCEVVN